MTRESDRSGSRPSIDSGDDAPIEHSAVDDLFGALANPVRRRILWYLLEGAPADGEELADVLAGWQATDDGIVGPEVRDGISIALYHQHLPVLERAGLITESDGTYRLSDLPDGVSELLRFAHRYERPVGSGGVSTADE